MATAAQAIAAIATKAAALTSGTRMVSDYSTDAQSLTRGATQFQVQSTAARDVRDSNQTFTLLIVALIVRYRVGAAEVEATYGDGARLTQQVSAADPSWWTAISEIHSIPDDGLPEISETTREGDVLEWSATVTIRVQP